MKKLGASFDKKVPAYRKKSTDNPREESITQKPFAEPITENSKKVPSLKTIYRTLSLRNLKKARLLGNLKRTLSLRTVKSFRTINDFCVVKSPFWFSVYNT